MLLSPKKDMVFDPSQRQETGVGGHQWEPSPSNPHSYQVPDRRLSERVNF